MGRGFTAARVLLTQLGAFTAAASVLSFPQCTQSSAPLAWGSVIGAQPGNTMLTTRSLLVSLLLLGSGCSGGTLAEWRVEEGTPWLEAAARQAAERWCEVGPEQCLPVRVVSTSEANIRVTTTPSTSGIGTPLPSEIDVKGPEPVIYLASSLTVHDEDFRILMAMHQMGHVLSGRTDHTVREYGVMGSNISYLDLDDPQPSEADVLYVTTGPGELPSGSSE